MKPPYLKQWERNIMTKKQVTAVGRKCAQSLWHKHNTTKAMRDLQKKYTRIWCRLEAAFNKRFSWFFTNGRKPIPTCPVCYGDGDVLENTKIYATWVPCPKCFPMLNTNNKRP